MALNDEDQIEHNSLLLNRVAQGLDTIENALRESRQSEHPKLFWSALYTMVYQSHPMKEEAYQAIADSGLKPTFTPCVLLVKDEFPEKNLGAICSLPEYEHEKALRLLIEVFRIADNRRRETQCSEGCSHWWHQDLPKQ